MKIIMIRSKPAWDYLINHKCLIGWKQGFKDIFQEQKGDQDLWHRLRTIENVVHETLLKQFNNLEKRE